MTDLHWSTVLLLLIAGAAAVYAMIRYANKQIDKDWNDEGFGR